jgi:hypothetical protein
MIASTWAELNEKSIGSPRYWSIALQNATFHRDMLPLARKYARGRVLDLGAGKLAWRADLTVTASHYVSADYSREHPDLVLNVPSILSSCDWHLLGLDSLIKPTTMLFLALSLLASSVDRRGLLAMNQLAVLRRPRG